VLRGHHGAVFAAALSADGSFAVTGGRDKQLMVWLTNTGQPAQSLLGHTNFVLCVDVSRDGLCIVGGSGDNSATLWTRAPHGLDGGSFTLGHRLLGHTERVYDVKITWDSAHVASASCDKSIRIWSIASGSCTRVLRGHRAGVLSCCFGTGESSKRMASGSDDTTIMLWNWQDGVKDGAALAGAEGHKAAVWSVRFSPDESLLVSAANAPVILVWSTSTRSVLCKLEGHGNCAVHRVIFLSSRILVSGGRDSAFVFWDLGTDRCTGTLIGRSESTHAGVIYALSVANDVLISASADETAKIWSLPGSE